MFTCPTCGENGTPGAQFCGSCGSRLVAEPSSDSHDPLVGQTIAGVYVVQQKLGSGGMGDVYKAIHKKLDSPVAIKLMKRVLLEQPAMLHRFEREARAASRLRHPNVVAVTDFGQMEDGTLFMVMEYVAGRSLARVIEEDGPLPERRVVQIGAQILAALTEAHANDVLHRDLKPENVAIQTRRDVTDAVKVLDFGIAKVLAAGAGASTLTQAGLVCGTPGYMSPEQLRGDDLDCRSDLFSVGVVLYEMLTHKLPFDVQTPMEMLHRHLSEPIPRPSVRRAEPVSPRLEALVMRALATPREDRPASAHEMREQLLAAAPDPRAGGEEESEVRLPTQVLPRRTPAGAEDGRARSTPPRAHDPPASPKSAAPMSGPRARVTGMRGTARPTPRPERTRTARAGSEAAAAAAQSYDPALLKRIEDQVAPLLGPVAPHLVRKVSRRAASIDDLCLQLSTFLPSADDQERFLAWSRAGLGGSGMMVRARSTPSGPRPAATWDPALLDHVRRQLAAYVGPLAGILVRRMSSRAHDARELYELLAREIPSDSEREAFRRLVPPGPG